MEGRHSKHLIHAQFRVSVFLLLFSRNTQYITALRAQLIYRTEHKSANIDCGAEINLHP